VPETQVTDVAALRRDYEKLRVSFELTRAIAAELDVDRLLAKIIETDFSCFRSTAGSCCCSTNAASFAACVRQKRTDRGEEVALSTTIINEVIRDRAAVLSSDGADGLALQGRAVDHHAGHPFEHGRAADLFEQLLGVMVLDSQVAGQRLTERTCS